MNWRSKNIKITRNSRCSILDICKNVIPLVPRPAYLGSNIHPPLLPLSLSHRIHPPKFIIRIKTSKFIIPPPPSTCIFTSTSPSQSTSTNHRVSIIFSPSHCGCDIYLGYTFLHASARTILTEKRLTTALLANQTCADFFEETAGETCFAVWDRG